MFPAVKITETRSLAITQEIGQSLRCGSKSIFKNGLLSLP